MVLTPRLSPPATPAKPATPVTPVTPKAVVPPAAPSHSTLPAQPAHPAAVEANEAIRALVDAQAGQDWSPVESAAYEVLLIEWAAATQGTAGDIIEAA
ncbi:hypothetical protein [Streptomyces sp. NPDC050255]|uniref:hypothetical protein n=1 Tax=Streptomyces sp. NPDC050255 TaxID=3365606 RepID=UPI00379A13B0